MADQGQMTVTAESISAEDKTILDASLTNKEKVMMSARLALAQGEIAELNHSNLVLRLAIKYKLTDGDSIDNITGEVKRKISK